MLQWLFNTKQSASDAGGARASGRGSNLGGVQNQASLTFSLGTVVLGHLAAKGLAGFAALLGGLDALNAAPALATFGFDLTHFLFGMMRPAVIAEKCVSHSSLNNGT